MGDDTPTDLPLPRLGERVRLGDVEGDVVRAFFDALVIEDDAGAAHYVTHEKWQTDSGIILPTRIVDTSRGYL